MRNLLHANLYRLCKNRIYLASLVFLAAYTFSVVNDHREVIHLLSFTNTTGPFSAVLISLFVGTDYSEGTIRNKLAVGHTRASIYLANLLAAFIGALLQNVASLAVLLTAGWSRIGLLEIPLERILSLLLASVGITAAFCAIFTFVSMLCTRRTTAALVCVVGALMMGSAAASIHDALNIPEYVTAMVESEAGVVEELKFANPGYIGGAKRMAYQLLMEIMPFGQVNLFYLKPPVGQLWRMIGYSAALTTGLTALGLTLFRRRDLK